MGLQIHGMCAGCNRTFTRCEQTDEDFNNVGNGFCDRCRVRARYDDLRSLKPTLQRLANQMGRNFMCKECWDAGHLGFLNPEGWLAGEIGDCWPLRLLIRRECPKCHGDPKSQLPPRPQGRFMFQGREPRTISEQVLAVREDRPTSPPPPMMKRREYSALMDGITGDTRPIFGMHRRSEE